MAETTTQIIREDPAIEKYRLGLLDAVSQFINENLANMPPPPVSAFCGGRGRKGGLYLESIASLSLSERRQKKEACVSLFDLSINGCFLLSELPAMHAAECRYVQ